MILSLEQGVDLTGRLVGAALLGGLLGHERQRSGKVAGLRTHMLVALGSATFVIGMVAIGGTKEEIARIAQGVAAGIGFIGAGAILKHEESDQVQGLTTAASVWMAAALGFTTAMGAILLSIAAAFVGWVILAVLGRLERVHATEH
jgi:putative Mg2+ transporter-C (MgtC) family protein